jgi:hypothetical protein
MNPSGANSITDPSASAAFTASTATRPAAPGRVSTTIVSA